MQRFGHEGVVTLVVKEPEYPCGTILRLGRHRGMAIGEDNQAIIVAMLINVVHERRKVASPTPEYRDLPTGVFER